MLIVFQIKRGAMLFAGLLTLLCCGLIAGGAWAKAEEITIGATVSRSGKFSTASFMVRNAYELWAKQLNQRGGLLGRPVRLIFYDDMSREDLCRKYYEKLIQEDKVDFVLSPYGSPLTMIASEVSEKNGLVMVAGSAANRKIWERGYKNVFGVHNLIHTYYINYLDLLARKKIANITVIYKKESTFEAALAGIVEWAPRFGITIDKLIGYEDDQAELPGLVKDLKSQNPYSVIWLSLPGSCYKFFDLLRANRYRPPVLSCIITPIFPDFISRAGEMGDKVFAPSLWEPDRRLPFPGTLEFIDAFKAYTGKSPTYHAAGSFGACQILEQAVNKTRSLDHSKIRDAVSRVNTLTVTGRFKVNDKGMQIGHKSIVIQWLDGHKQIVHPRQTRTTEPVF
jgi:branched-chain amino acid transport system substrate-binding protein